MIIVKSVHTQKYRQENGTWGFSIEKAMKFDPTYRHLVYYRENPIYYEVIEIPDL